MTAMGDPHVVDDIGAEMLDLLPERVVRYRVPDRTIVDAVGHDAAALLAAADADADADADAEVYRVKRARCARTVGF